MRERGKNIHKTSDKIWLNYIIILRSKLHLKINIVSSLDSKPKYGRWKRRPDGPKIVRCDSTICAAKTFVQSQDRKIMSLCAQRKFMQYFGFGEINKIVLSYAQHKQTNKWARCDDDDDNDIRV